ncbi:hypothetical protein V1506DRAFT_505712 [Lipomyces tetrasporus]
MAGVRGFNDPNVLYSDGKSRAHDPTIRFLDPAEVETLHQTTSSSSLQQTSHCGRGQATSLSAAYSQRAATSYSSKPSGIRPRPAVVGRSQLAIYLVMAEPSYYNQGFLIHQADDAFSDAFYIKAARGSYLASNGRAVGDMARAESFTIGFKPGFGHTIIENSGAGEGKDLKGTGGFYECGFVSECLLCCALDWLWLW